MTDEELLALYVGRDKVHLVQDEQLYQKSTLGGLRRVEAAVRAEVIDKLEAVVFAFVVLHKDEAAAAVRKVADGLRAQAESEARGGR